MTTDALFALRNFEQERPDIRQLVEIEVLKDLQDNFSRLLGLNVAFAGLDCETVGGARRFAEGTPVEKTTCQMLSEGLGDRLCRQSDVEAGDIAKKERKTVCYRCRFYCSNFVIPIVVVNHVIGFIYSGQFFVHLPHDEIEEAIKKHDPHANILIRDRFAEANAIYWNDDGPHIIRKHFFTNVDYPTDDELRTAGGEAVIADIDGFVELFKQQSNLKGIGQPGSRVKDFEYVLSAIMTLSSVAKAISEECTHEYELKRKSKIEGYVFEACNQTYLDVAQTHFPKKHRKRKFEMDEDLKRMGSAMKAIHEGDVHVETEKAWGKQVELLHALEEKRLVIYSILLEEEIEQAEGDFKWNQWFYYLPSDKDPEDWKEELQEARILIRDARKLEGNSMEKLTKSGMSPMEIIGERIKNLKRALDNIKEYRRQLHKVRGKNRVMNLKTSLVKGKTTRIALTVIAILGGIGSIIELLKAFGVVK